MNLKKLLLEEKTDLRYLENIQGETFQIDLEMDKSGLNITMTPTNDEGSMIKNLTPEEIETLNKSLLGVLQPKFSKYKMVLTSEKGGKKSSSFSIKFKVPIESMFPLFKNIIVK